jgi:cytohesin
MHGGNAKIGISNPLTTLHKNTTKSVNILEVLLFDQTNRLKLKWFFTLFFIITSSVANADCGNLCTWHWWTTATADTLEAEIAKGSDINGRNFHDGDTPLHEASMYGNAALIKILIEHGARTEAVNGFDYTPLQSASRYGNPSTRDERINALIKSGANIHAESNSGASSILLVLETGDYNSQPSLESVRSLLNAGANVNKADNQGITPLHLASKYASPEMVKLLIERRADVFALDNNQNSALHYASEGKFTENLKLLISAGTDINSKNASNLTPLHRASNMNRIDNVKALLELGSEVSETDNQGTTPIFHAIKSASVENNGTLMHAGSFSQQHRIEIINLLISAGSNVNHSSKKFNRPLHYAAKFATNEDIIVLIDNGADIKATNNENETAFDVATDNDRVRSTKIYWNLKPS